MSIDICLASTIIDIIDNGLITAPINSSILEFAETKHGLIEVFNILIATHKKRYIQCYTEADKEIEISNIIQDFRKIFKETAISDHLVKYIFKLSVCDNFKSLAFREVVVGIIEELKTCEVPEIKYTLMQKIIQYIINLRLYIEDPFATILKQAYSALSDAKDEFGEITTQLFLE